MKRVGYVLGLSFLIQSGFCGTTKYDKMFNDKLKISDIVVIHRGGSVFDITIPGKNVIKCDIKNWSNPGNSLISVTKNKGFDICSIKNGKDIVSFCWWNNALTVLNSSYRGNVAVKADNVCILHDNKFNNFYAQGEKINNQGNLGAEKEITLFAPQMSLTGNTETDSNIWNSNYKWRMVSNSFSSLDVYPNHNNSGFVKGQSVRIENVSNFYDGRLDIGWMNAREVIVDGEDYLHYSHRWNDAVGDIGQVQQQLNELSWPPKIHDQNLVDIAKKTVDIMKNRGNKTFQLPQNDYCKSIFIDQKKAPWLTSNCIPKPNQKKCNINNSRYFITNEDSFEASKGYDNPLVMNLANAFRPGGGFLMGSHAQEESLCRSSTLYASLLSNKSKYHDYNRDLRENTKKIYHNRGGLFGLDRMLISPWVYVFRDSNYQLIDPYRVAVVTIAAPDLGDGDGGKRHTGEAYTAIQHRVTNQTKMRNAILKQLKDMIITAAYYGYKNLVLGAFGCGAFAQDPHVIAQIYYEILVNEGYGSYFDNIKFSVKGHDARARRLRDAFNFVFQTRNKYESDQKNMETINGSQLMSYIDLKNGYFLENSRSGNKYLMAHTSNANYRHTTVTEKLAVLQKLGSNMTYGGIWSIDDQIEFALKKKFSWNKVSEAASHDQFKQRDFDKYDKHKYLGDIDPKHPGRLYVLEGKTIRSKGKANSEIFAMAFDRTKAGKSCLRTIDDNEKQVVLDHLHNVWKQKHGNQQFNHKCKNFDSKIAEIAKKMYKI